ncbi:MAG: hypothetical protein QF785_12070 [Phycisphaeraceae bacterium]|jgi:hypothetical protein|nr:hypothetical protein [Phycisphaeraceae bacterium]
MKRLILLSALTLLTACAVRPRAQVEPTPFVRIDGRPRLVIGLYEHLDDEPSLTEAAAAGFNLIYCGASRTSLDRMQAHGLYGWVNLGGTLALQEGDEAGRQKLTDTVNRLKDHPALLVWEGPDEPLWNIWYAPWLRIGDTAMPALRKVIDEQPPGQQAQLIAMAKRCDDYWRRAMWVDGEKLYDDIWRRMNQPPFEWSPRITSARQRADKLGDELSRGFELVGVIDPGRVRWLNHAPRNSVGAMQHYNRHVDMAGCDIYPMPASRPPGHSDLPVPNATAVGAYTDRMREAAPGKIIAMVLQGFGWVDSWGTDPPSNKDFRRPTRRELRFMCYNALAHGTGAILFFGTSHIEKDSQFWRDLLAVTRELRTLEPALVAGPRDGEVTCVADEGMPSQDGDAVQLMFRQIGEEFVLVAINERKAGVTFTVSDLPPALKGRTLYRLGSDESHVIGAGQLRDGIGGHDVHVYSTSRAFGVEPNM